MRIRTRSRSSLTEETAHDLLADLNGDYSGRPLQPLTQINSSNVHQLRSPGLAVSQYQCGRRGRDQGRAVLVNGILYFSCLTTCGPWTCVPAASLWHYTYPHNTAAL